MIPVVGLDPSLTGLGLATPDGLSTIRTLRATADRLAAEARR